MTSTSNTADDVRQLAQMTIDLPALDKYYHPDVAGRKHLCVVENQQLTSKTPLSKFGQPVRFVSGADSRAADSACLEFSQIEVSGDSAAVEFSYKVEGIRGSARFKRVSGTWTLDSHKLSEK